ncbi:hypothetical protein Aperf_G00000017180 [Anoplocephala perfoliata]
MGLTPLHVAAQRGHKQTLRILLFSGADVGATDKFGNTCLHTAIRYGRASIVKILLASSANVMATNQNLETPLHIAASLKRTKIARCLLKGRGSSSSTLTLKMENKSTSPLLSSTTSSSFVAAAQAALWMRNAQGETPLDVARRHVRGGKESSDMVALLLEQMNDVQYENGTTKSLPRSSGSGSGSGHNSAEASATPVATPYMSTDLIYSPLQKKKTVGAIKLAFKTRKIAKSQCMLAAKCNGYSNNHVQLGTDLSHPAVSATSNNRLHQIQTEPEVRVSTTSENGVSIENPSYHSPMAKDKSRAIRWSLLGGLFRRDHGKTGLACDMKKSESSFIRSPESSKLFAQNELPILKMPTSVSFSTELNESHSSTQTGRNILQEATLSADDPVHQSILLGRFLELPFPQNGRCTSAGDSSIHPPENPSAINSNEGIRDGNVATSLPSTALRNHSIAVRTTGGSNERTRHRLGVRFDLENNGTAHGHDVITGPTASHGRQHSTQLYFDLAGNLKKGPVGSSAGCNCIQRQADYFSGKIPIFVPCSAHSYLEFHGSATNLRNPDPFPMRRYRGGRPGPPNNANSNKIKPWKRSRSDESLSVRAHVNAEPPTSAIPVATVPVTATTVTSSMATGTTTNVALVSEAATRVPNGRPLSVNYENLSLWSVNGHQAQKANGEAPEKANGHQKMFPKGLCALILLKTFSLQNTMQLVLGCEELRQTTEGTESEECTVFAQCHQVFYPPLFRRDNTASNQATTFQCNTSFPSPPVIARCTDHVHFYFSVQLSQVRQWTEKTLLYFLSLLLFLSKHLLCIFI